MISLGGKKGMKMIVSKERSCTHQSSKLEEKKKLELVPYNFYKILKAYLKNLRPEFSGYKNPGLSFSDP